MKKIKSIQIFILCCVFIIFSIFLCAGCSREDKIAWKEIIYTEYFSEDSVVENALKESVSIDVKQTDERLNIKISAPYICEELLAWLDTVKEEEFTEENMETKILELLKETKKRESVCELEFSIQEEDVKIYYSAEFSDLMSCGLNHFYAQLNYRIQEEIGGNR